MHNHKMEYGMIKIITSLSYALMIVTNISENLIVEMLFFCNKSYKKSTTVLLPLPGNPKNSIIKDFLFIFRTNAI